MNQKRFYCRVMSGLVAIGSSLMFSSTSFAGTSRLYPVDTVSGSGTSGWLLGDFCDYGDGYQHWCVDQKQSSAQSTEYILNASKDKTISFWTATLAETGGPSSSSVIDDVRLVVSYKVVSPQNSTRCIKLKAEYLGTQLPEKTICQDNSDGWISTSFSLPQVILTNPCGISIPPGVCVPTYTAVPWSYSQLKNVSFKITLKSDSATGGVALRHVNSYGVNVDYH